MTAQNQGPKRARRYWIEHGLVLLAYTALTAAMTYPLILQFAQAIPGDGFDGWQNFWNLWWVRVALIEQGSNPIFTNMLYYPTGVSLAFHTLNVFNGLFTLPIQLLFGLFPAYNTVVYFSFAVGAFGAYLLARYALRKAGWHERWAIWPAIMAGVIYGFSPFHFAHLLGHMQVLSLEWLPFSVLALLRGLDQLDGASVSGRRIMRAAAQTAIFLILVGLCDWYYAMYIGLFSGLVIVYRLLARQFAWRYLAMIALAWLTFLVVLSPMWIPMAQEVRRAGYMVPDETQALDLSADLLAFVTPNEFHPLWGDAASEFAGRFASTASERIIFAGYLPLALGLLATWKLGRRSRFWWVATLTFVICALGPILHIAGQTEFTAAGITIPLPYILLYRALPVIRIARSIARFDVMVMLNLSILASLGLAYLIERIGRVSWGRKMPAAVIGITAIAMICFEFLSLPYPFSPPDTPAFYEQIADESGEFAILSLPMNWDRPGYLLYQTVHAKPLTVAYISRNDPRTLVYRAPVLQEFRHLGEDILTDDVGRLGSSVLDWLGIRYVVLDRFKMPGGPEREITTALAEQMFDGAEPLYEDDRLTIYQVTPPAERLPFAVLGEGWGPRIESNDSVWRSINRDAVLLVQSEPGRNLRLTARIEEPAACRLTLRFAGGNESQSNPAPAGSTAVVEWTSNAEESQIELIVESKKPCKIGYIQVEYIER